MIHLAINGQNIATKPGRTILQVTREHGIPIPTLCYHEALEPFAACRLCLVELESPKGPQLVASCAHPCQEGLVVHTDSELVRRSRRITVELLMATSAHVPIVQKLAAELGVSRPRFTLPAEACILCGLCVRACQEIVGVGAINLINRGIEKRVSPPFRIASPSVPVAQGGHGLPRRTGNDCIECGTCVLICPTGAMALADITGGVQTIHPWPSLFEWQACHLCGQQDLGPVFADVEDLLAEEGEAVL